MSKKGTDPPTCLAKEKQELAGRLKIATPITVILDMSDPFFTDNKIDTTANVRHMTSNRYLTGSIFLFSSSVGRPLFSNMPKGKNVIGPKSSFGFQILNLD